MISASIGIAAAPIHGDHVQDLLRAADTALYAAKERGRDRAEVSDRVAPVDASRMLDQLLLAESQRTP